MATRENTISARRGSPARPRRQTAARVSLNSPWATLTFGDEAVLFAVALGLRT